MRRIRSCQGWRSRGHDRRERDPWPRSGAHGAGGDRRNLVRDPGVDVRGVTAGSPPGGVDPASWSRSEDLDSRARCDLTSSPVRPERSVRSCRLRPSAGRSIRTRGSRRRRSCHRVYRNKLTEPHAPMAQHTRASVEDGTQVGHLRHCYLLAGPRDHRTFVLGRRTLAPDRRTLAPSLHRTASGATGAVPSHRTNAPAPPGDNGRHATAHRDHLRRSCRHRPRNRAESG